MKMIFRNTSFVFFLILFFVSDIFSQEYNYTHYDVKDGLAGSTVYSIVQDKEGFLWYGTETGLSRFDGTHFKNFYTTDGLPDNEIIKLFVDSKNRVWIIPFKNSLCYYWKGKIHNQENDSLLKKINISAEVVSVIEDSSRNILILEAHSAYIINSSDQSHALKCPDHKIFDFLKGGIDKFGKFKLAMVDETANPNVFKYADIHDFNIIAGPSLEPEITTGNNYSSVMISAKVDILIKSHTFSIESTNNNWLLKINAPIGFIALSNIDDSLITFNTYNGAYLINLNQKKITDTFMPHQAINCITKDTEEDLWISVPGKGVYELLSGRFMNYLYEPVFSLKKLDSILYIGSDKFNLFKLNTNKESIVNHSESAVFSRGRITSILQDFKNNLIVGTDNGVFIVKKDRMEEIDNYHSLGAIKSINIESDSSILTSSHLGVYKQPIENFRKGDTIWRERATYAFADSGKHYIGTLNGLYLVRSDKSVEYLGNKYAAFKSRINSINKSNDGIIWIATNGSGLVAFKNNHIIRTITETDGLTSNICRNIFISSNSIWVGTDKGLNKISYSDSNSKITTFTRSDGLNSDIINAVEAENDEVYVGTPEGLAYFNESQVSKKSICNLRITAINASGVELPYDTNRFVLRHENNNIEFQFVGISYKSGGKISYRYRLIGLDTNWKTTNNTSLNYTSLPSGEYELQLKATNKFGQQSNLIKTHFFVAKTLIEKMWFRILFIAAIIFLVWLIVSYRIKVIRKKENEKSETVKKISELEQMALKSQMNPHFIFNCLNSIQHYVIDKDILGANEFISSFSRLIRLTLDNSSKASIKVGDEISYITAYLELEQKRFEDKFTFDIIIDDISRQQYFLPPMILQPYIENAIRHGIRYREDDNGKLIVKFEKSESYLIATVSDNGIGRKLSQQLKGKNSIEYQSKGMDLTARRIEMFNKIHSSKIIINVDDLEEMNGNSNGTKVTIYFPLKEIEDEHRI
jgi:sensor histidine kinase YesM